MAWTTCGSSPRDRRVDRDVRAILETTYNAFVRIHVRESMSSGHDTLSVQDVVVASTLGDTRAMAYGTIFLSS